MTDLLDTNEYAQAGALFWPDYVTTPLTNSIWTITRTAHTIEREFETGVIAVDKRRAWRALKAAAHFCSHASFYNRYLWGDKDTFRFGFKVAGLEYAFNPAYLVSLGVLVSGDNPKGGVALLENGEIPAGAGYCGQNMVQMDFAQGGGEPQPLFIHANGIRKNYKDEVPPFQVAQTYKEMKAGIEVGKYRWIGPFHAQDHCGEMDAEPSLTIINYGDHFFLISTPKESNRCFFSRFCEEFHQGQ